MRINGDQDTTAAEFDLPPGGRGNQTPINLEPMTPLNQDAVHPSGDASSQYPNWTVSSIASSSRVRDNPRIVVTSPTVPSTYSRSTESHYNVYKGLYDSHHQLAPSTTHEAMTYSGLPPRPSSPVPSGRSRSTYSPVERRDEGAVGMQHDPTSLYDPPSLKSNRGLVDKMTHGELPAIPISGSATVRPPHTRTESQTPPIRTDIAPESSRAQPWPGSQTQPQPQPQRQIQSTLQPPPEPPMSHHPTASILDSTYFPSPSDPSSRPPASEHVGKGPFDDSYFINRTYYDNGGKQPPDAPRHKALVPGQDFPNPFGSPHFPPSTPATTQMGTNIAPKSQRSNAPVDRPTITTFSNIAPSTSHQPILRPANTAPDTERSQTWFSNVDSLSSPSRQYSLDSPLPSSKALSHTHGDKKEGLVADAISPVKFPDLATPSTGGPTPSLWEFPVPPGGVALQHTKSDPQPVPTKSQRLRTKSSLSNVVATAENLQRKDKGVVVPRTHLVTESPRSYSPNGVISRSMGSVMTTGPQAGIRKPIPPGFLSDLEGEQKGQGSGTDTHGESTENHGNLLSDIPVILAGSLTRGDHSPGEQTSQTDGRTDDSARPSMEGDIAHHESSICHTCSAADYESLERAEIKTAEVAIRSPPSSVPELARWDTISHISHYDDTAFARTRSGSNVTTNGSTRKRKAPDESPPPVPSLRVAVGGQPGDSFYQPSGTPPMVEGQTSTRPTSPAVPWTPSPARAQVKHESTIYSASTPETPYIPQDRPPWQPLRVLSPPGDGLRSPPTPPPVPAIPESTPISLEDTTPGPPVSQETDRRHHSTEERHSETEHRPAEEQPCQAEPAIVTVHEASPRTSSEMDDVDSPRGHTPGSSTHSQATTDTFGLNTATSIVPRARGPRMTPAHDSEPSGSGTSVTSVAVTHHTGGTSGSGSQNDGYFPTVDPGFDFVFGPPPPVPELSEPETASDSHTAEPPPHKTSPKTAPVGLLTPISPPRTKPLPQASPDAPLSSGSSISSTVSSPTTRRAGSTRPVVGVVRGPRDRSSSARAVLPSSSRGYPTKHSRHFSSSSVPAPLAHPSPTLVGGNATSSPNLKRDSIITNSNHSILDLYAHSPLRSNASSPDPPPLPPNGQYSQALLP
jgi:hypothetical protein